MLATRGVNIMSPPKTVTASGSLMPSPEVHSGRQASHARPKAMTAKMPISSHGTREGTMAIGRPFASTSSVGVCDPSIAEAAGPGMESVVPGGWGWTVG